MEPTKASVKTAGRKRRQTGSSYRQQRRLARESGCHCCGQRPPFCWQCRCGFSMCQDCMDENFWGVSCNGITWQCPDCGEWNGYGNQ